MAYPTLKPGSRSSTFGSALQRPGGGAASSPPTARPGPTSWAVISPRREEQGRWEIVLPTITWLFHCALSITF
jgi:hypothetical protein